MESIKEAAIIQLSASLFDKHKSLSEYRFDDGDEHTIYLSKTNGLKMIINLASFNIAEITDEVYRWTKHKELILDSFHKLNVMYDDIVKYGTYTDNIELICKLDMYLPKPLIKHFIGDTDAMTIVNPIAFSNIDTYILSFKNVIFLKLFIESKLFFMVNEIK